MSKHTRGPWRVGVQEPYAGTRRYAVRIVSENPRADETQTVLSPGSMAEADGRLRDNAERIVACVNACEGIEDPSVVPEMLQLLKAIQAHILENEPFSVPRLASNLYKVIARAEGKR